MSSEKDEETQLCVWGNNMFSQLAFENPNNEPQVFIPKLLSFAIHISEITCGFNHSLFRSMEGQVYAVGNNSKGQLGIEAKIRRRTAPTLVAFPDPEEKVLLACAQGHHNLVYTEVGRFYTWGDNSRGQLGTGNTQIAFVPFDITASIEIEDDESAVALACGKHHSMLLMTSGRSWAWGANSSWQLGVQASSSDDVLKPKLCAMPRATQIAAGYSHSLWRDDKGGVWGVGDNSEGNLLGDKENYKVPIKLNLGEKIKKIHATHFSAAITEKDQLLVWGRFMGQDLPVTSPFDEEPSFNPSNSMGKSGQSPKQRTRVSTVGLGENFIVAADDMGECYSWGSNETGQLGQVLPDEQEDLANETAPKRLEILLPFDVRAISVGPNFVYTMVTKKVVDQYEQESVQTEEKMHELEESDKRDDHDDEFQSDSKKKYTLDQSGEDNAIKFLEVCRVLIYLYENLRLQLISIIDSKIEVETVLSAELVALIKAQQDVIDSFLTRFDLKRRLNFDIDEENLAMFNYPDCIPLAKQMSNGDAGADLNGLDFSSNNAMKLKMMSELKMKISQDKQIITERINSLRRVLNNH